MMPLSRFTVLDLTRVRSGPTCVRQLADWGYGGCALAVVVGNAPAMLFYERLGGRRAGGFTDPGPLWPSDNIVFVWDELSALIGDGRY